jgi:hypothetical protein
MEKEKKYYTQELVDSAIEELEERLVEEEIDSSAQEDEIIAEIADNNVPIYTYDLLQYASNNFDLIYPNELCNEESTVTGIIMANIYELLHTELCNAICEIIDNEKENEKE